MDANYLNDLRVLLENKTQAIPPWLEDLLSHGPRWEQWESFPERPNRVILTECLARWLKMAGLSQEECLNWLLAYVFGALSEFSKTGPSGIRHGTKANVRWVYSSPFIFNFEAMAQEPPEPGFEAKPPYMSIFLKWQRANWEEKDRARREYVPPVFERVLPKKQRFAEQFNKAMEFAQKKRQEGEKLPCIVEELNAQGFLSRTGRKFTVSVLHTSLRKLNPPI